MRTYFSISATFLLSTLSLFVILLFGCSKAETDAAVSPARSTSLTNTVWEVSESDGVATGALYVFLSEGTLVIASKNNKPGVGSWRKTNSGLEVVEEGIAYRVDAEINGDQLTLVYHNPAGETEIKLVPAR